ncbi:MAG: formylglycine-generating enzyme family protein [Nitrospinota bacterium]
MKLSLSGLTRLDFFSRIALYLVILLVVAIIVSRYNRTETFQKEMVFIPAGEFLVGSNDIETFKNEKKEFGISQDLFLEDERPLKKVFINAFYIDMFEVTNREYKRFIDMTNHPFPPVWKNGIYPAKKDRHPVQNVSWFNAEQFCKWSNKRLPTEEEWEKAARGPQRSRYPWGNEFDIKKANFENGKTLEVGSVEGDKSFYGVYDMAGNVMEWTSSWYKPYPGFLKKSKKFGKVNKVIRGWSGTDLQHYNLPRIFGRSSHRHAYPPYQFGDDVGFRCAKDAEKEKR